MEGFSYFDFTFLIILIVLTALWIRSRRDSDYPPGPTPIPIIGNIHNIAKDDFLLSIRGLRKRYGDLFSLSLGSFWVIFVSGKENLRELLVKQSDSTTDRPPLFVFEALRNKGILSSSGSQWKHQRTFALSKLREFGFGKFSFQSKIMEEIECFCNLLESYNKRPIDISGFIQTSMSNIVMAITVGRRFEYDDSKFKYFVQLLDENSSNAALTGLLNFLPFLAKLPGDPFSGKRIKHNVDAQLEFLREEIMEHKKTLDKNNIRDFIDVYLMAIEEDKDTGNNIFTEEQLISVMGDLFGAGTETTATTIRWAIMYFLHYDNKDIQEKIQKEIEDVVGYGRPPTMADKPNLPYCDAVMHEALRMGNIVPFSLPHYVTDDIYYNGFKIPKHSVLIPNLDSVALDEKLFSDCRTFKPERFIDENGKLSGLQNVLTFSLGRRVCLGEALARMELFLYLTSLVQKFQFLPPEGELPPPIKGRLGVTWSPDSYKFRAVPRN